MLRFLLTWEWGVMECMMTGSLTTNGSPGQFRSHWVHDDRESGNEWESRWVQVSWSAWWQGVWQRMGVQRSPGVMECTMTGSLATNVHESWCVWWHWVWHRMGSPGKSKSLPTNREVRYDQEFTHQEGNLGPKPRLWNIGKHELVCCQTDNAGSCGSSIDIGEPRDYKKDLYRRDGKGRHCCLGDRIYSIPCDASYFAPGWYEEKDEFHQDDMKKRMSSSYSSYNPCAQQGIEQILSPNQQRRPSMIKRPFDGSAYWSPPLWWRRLRLILPI